MSHSIIVGAGPLGLMAALGLSEHYEKITLIGPDAPYDGRTTAILNEGLTFLDELGLWKELVEKTAPLKVMRIVDGTQRLIRGPEARFDSRELKIDCFGHNIMNKDLLKALNDAIESRSSIERIKQTVVDVTFDDSGQASVTLDNGAVLTTSLIVAADGRKSMIRDTIGIKTKKWSYPQVAIVMNLSHTRDHGFASTEFHTESGPFTLVPLPGKNSSLVWVEKPDIAENILSLTSEELAQRIAQKSHYILGDITIETKPMAYPLSGLMANEFGRGPLVLVGESAHVFPPIGAQGMNLGIRDIKALMACIDTEKPNSAPSLSSISHNYSNARKIDVSMRTKAVDMLNRSLLTDMLPIHLGRGLGLFALNLLPNLRKFVMKKSLGTQ